MRWSAVVIVWVILSGALGAGCGSVFPDGPVAGSGVARGSGEHAVRPDPAPLQAAATVRPELPGRQWRGRLRSAGRWLAYPDGSRFRWRGVTGLMLNERVANGREADARTFLEWARRTGFNVVRLLVMLPKSRPGAGPVMPEQGLAALPRTLALAREADLYVHVTVLTETAALPRQTDLARCVERAGQACAAEGNCALVETADEVYHPYQRADVRDPAMLARWAARVPAGIPTALGIAPGVSGALVASAPVITMRVGRGGDRWDRAKRVRDLGVLSEQTGRFVIDSEPIPAGDVAEPGKMDNEPEVFFAQGALSRIFEVGSTFNFKDGFGAVLPGSLQQRSADAFIAGTRIVHDDYMMTFQDAGWPASPIATLGLAGGRASGGSSGSPVPGSADGSAEAAYAGLTQVFPAGPGPTNVVLLLGVVGNPRIGWRAPWRQTGVIVEFPHVRAWSIGRLP